MDNEKKTDNNKKRFHHRRRHHRRGGDAKKKAEAASAADSAAEVLSSPEEVIAIPQAPESEELLSTPIETAQAPSAEEPPLEVTKTCIATIRFRPAGKNYSFDPNGLSLMVGDSVIVETSQGNEFGTVSAANRMVPEKDLVLPLKKVLRQATAKDLEQFEKNKELEKRGRKVFVEKAAEHKLDMALSDVECAFDQSKLIFYFTSEGRVDFREFVKEMASVFKTRIELRQIGVRDEAKQLGGLGICGRPLCCSTFLEDFQQVSIKMAKEQNLSLNPTKISGTCGRLMCCLRYENDVYVEAAKHCPRADCNVMCEDGKGVVVESNLLCGICKVRLETDPDNIRTYTADQLKIIPKQKKSSGSDKPKNERPKEKQEN